MLQPRLIALASLALVTVVTSAQAQWSPDPAVNLSVGDAASDQNQPKLAPTSDGGTFVSWFDGIGSGWDVRVQRLDAAGAEQFPHNGVLVADRSFSSTQDYGLDLDIAGNALLAFRDDTSGTTQIAAAKVSPTGTLLFGGAVIPLTNTGNFVAAPKIAGTSDGGAVIAWTEAATVTLQKLDALGVPQWGAGVVLSSGSANYSVSDLQSSGNDVTLSFISESGGFGSPRRLLAQKLDATGALLWGAVHVQVFLTSSIQFGNFPAHLSDENGGAIFAWYDASTFAFECYAQRILSNGTVAFGPEGALGSTNTLNVRVSPHVSYDSLADETYLFWTEQGAGDGVYGQKFDASGNRLWADGGVEVAPISSDTVSFVSSVRSGSDSLVFWDSSSGFNSDVVRGARVNSAGVTTLAPFDVASTPSGKARLTSAGSALGFAMLAWSDNRVDDGDILMQNVNADGSLGAPSSPDDFCSGDGGDQMGCTDCPCGNNAAVGTIGGCLNQDNLSAQLTRSGVASVAADSLRFEMTGGTSLSFAVLVSGASRAPAQMANPCFGLDSGVTSISLDGLRCAVQAVQRHGSRSISALGVVGHGMGGAGSNGWGPPSGPASGLIAQGGFVAGETRHYQVIYRTDETLGCATGQNTSQGVSVSIVP